jgi:signal transduction histidine kinase
MLEATAGQTPGTPLAAPGVVLPPAIHSQLLDPSAWREGLEKYARATNLAVALTEADGRLLGECINPRPTWGLLHAEEPAGAATCPFYLLSLRSCSCVANALVNGGFRLVRDRTGLVHFAVPLVLGEHRLGALVAGQVFDQYPDQLALEHAAKQVVLPPKEVWQLARLEHPVKQGTLRVYADLLATLGQMYLQTRYHTLIEANRLAEMTQLRDLLQQRTQELTEADRRKDEFLAMLAHELRNPLAPLRSALQILRLTDVDPDPRVWQARDLMERQVQQLVRLVDDLLDISRITRGKIELRKERVDLASVMASAVEGSRPLIEARKHTLEAMLPQDALMVEADPVRLTQVLSNLLNNAAKFTPGGGQIWLTAERAGGEAIVRVRDTGAGIPANLLSTVFELFTQVNCTAGRAEGGLGIGLTLVRRLTEMHGGTVEAFSAGPDQGSEFVVRLPLLPDTPPRDEVKERNGVKGGQPPTIGRRLLVVDDNQDAAESLAALLRLLGHDVRTAPDGQIALEVAAAHHPEVVLLDLGLPGMNGWEVCRRLRRQVGLKGALVVALTGYGQEEDRRHSREVGFNAHLVKPVDLAALQELLAHPELAGYTSTQ